MDFHNIENLQLKKPPQFVDLLGLNFGATVAWEFLWILVFIGKFSRPKLIMSHWTLKILSKIEKVS